jgi:hypothetical protein
MYFHNGNYKSTTIFNQNECLYEEVYVTQMQKGYYLKSEIPYFFSSSNGHLSISSQIKTFGYYDSNNTRIETFELTFITECQITETSENEKGDTGFLSLLVIWPIIPLLIIFWILINKRRKNHPAYDDFCSSLALYPNIF